MSTLGAGGGADGRGRGGDGAGGDGGRGAGQWESGAAVQVVAESTAEAGVLKKKKKAPFYILKKGALKRLPMGALGGSIPPGAAVYVVCLFGCALGVMTAVLAVCCFAILLGDDTA